MQIKKTFLLLLTLGIVASLALVGCSSQSAKSESESTETKTGAQYPIKIKHALGETVIKSKPKRIVTIQWGNQDIALALGVVPVGFSAANFGVQDDSGLLPWTKKELDKLGEKKPNVFQDTDGLDFEAIADAQPDVILAAYSGITAEDYETLSQIAPVVAYPSSPWTTTWREQVKLNAAGMGMKKEGEQLIKDTEDLISKKLADYPQIKGKKVVWVNFSAKDLSQLHIYTPADSRGALLEEFGLKYPDSVKEMIKDPKDYTLRLSAENVEALYDADLIVGYGDDALYKTIKADPLLGKIPAVKRGSVAFIPSESPIVAAGTPTPLSIEYTIDEYLELIGGAIDKIEQ
ncbi:iron complex transport system substrate-binding protein [Kroppenstedtia sanguinis]|uniref:Iron-siderophore ABC transporter substrate-binding protein n=1 Tax=Kroppenstedtia sanguinis TaxID=1380684 RepID=A0ABW4CAV8_9BACL